MGGGVHLQHVDVPAFHDRLAVHAHRRHGDGRALHRAVGQFVVQRAGEDARRRRLADAAHAGEDPGLRHAAGLERVRDRADHGLLADEIVESWPGDICAPARGSRCRRPDRGRARRSRMSRRRSCAIRGCDAGRHLEGGALHAAYGKGGRLTSDPNRSSLGLLPSGPDPVGEWSVHRQPPGPIWDQSVRKASTPGKLLLRSPGS